MPITKKKDGWYWGKQGPYPTKKKAEEVVAAIYWKKRKEEKTQRGEMPKKKPYRGKYIKDGKIIRKEEWEDILQKKFSNLTREEYKNLSNEDKQKFHLDARNSYYSDDKYNLKYLINPNDIKFANFHEKMLGRLRRNSGNDYFSLEEYENDPDRDKGLQRVARGRRPEELERIRNRGNVSQLILDYIKIWNNTRGRNPTLQEISDEEERELTTKEINTFNDYLGEE